MRRGYQWEDEGPSQKNIWTRSSITKRFIVEGVDSKKTKKWTYDQDIIGAIGGVVCTFHVWVHSHQIINMDFEY